MKLISQIEELKVECHSFDHSLVGDVEVEKMVLESREEADNIILDDSSACKYENAKFNEIFGLDLLGMMT